MNSVRAEICGDKRQKTFESVWLNRPYRLEIAFSPIKQIVATRVLAEILFKINEESA